jgi:hypothetical protein
MICSSCLDKKMCPKTKKKGHARTEGLRLAEAEATAAATAHLTQAQVVAEAGEGEAWVEAA